MANPIDVLVLMDESAFRGCVLSCRPIGVIEGEQGRVTRSLNEMPVAIGRPAPLYQGVRTVLMIEVVTEEMHGSD